MLTFVTTESDIAEVRFSVLKNNQVVYMNPGEQIEGQFDPAIETEADVGAFFVRASKEYLLEVDISTHLDSNESEVGKVQVSSQKVWSEALTKNQVSLKQGYNLIDIEKTTDEAAKKTTSFFPIFFGYFSRNSASHYSGFSSNYVVVKCKTKCKYVLSLKVPNHLQTIAENTIKEAILLPEAAPDIYNFWLDGKKSPLKFKIHIRSSHLKQPNLTQDQGFRFTKEMVAKMIKLEYTSTKPSVQKNVVSKPIQFKTDESHLDDRTLRIELKDLEMGQLKLTVQPQANFIIQYQISYSTGDFEVVLPGNYIVDRVMTNLHWHYKNPQVFANFKKDPKNHWKLSDDPDVNDSHFREF